MKKSVNRRGFLKGAADNNATVSKKKVAGKNYTVLTWSPKVKAPSGKNYTVNGYVDEKNIVDRVETWLGDVNALVDDLKRTAPGDVWVAGAAKAIRAFIAASIFRLVFWVMIRSV